MHLFTPVTSPKKEGLNSQRQETERQTERVTESEREIWPCVFLVTSSSSFLDVVDGVTPALASAHHRGHSVYVRCQCFTQIAVHTAPSLSATHHPDMILSESVPRANVNHQVVKQTLVVIQCKSVGSISFYSTRVWCCQYINLNLRWGEKSFFGSQGYLFFRRALFHVSTVSNYRVAHQKMRALWLVSCPCVQASQTSKGGVKLFYLPALAVEGTWCS